MKHITTITLEKAQIPLDEREILQVVFDFVLRLIEATGKDKSPEVV